MAPTNKGDLIRARDMPRDKGGKGYDIGINSMESVMLTPSFTSWNSHMVDFGKMLRDREAMQCFGQDVSRATKRPAGSELLHVLELLLVERNGWIREIHTTAYLAPQVVVSDFKTLLLEDGVKVD